MHCLRPFSVVLQELHCLPNCLHVFMIRVIGCYHVTQFRYSTPEIAKCINYIVYYNVYCYNCGVFTEKNVHTKFRLDWLLCE